MADVKMIVVPLSIEQAEYLEQVMWRVFRDDGSPLALQVICAIKTGHVFAVAQGGAAADEKAN